MRIQQNKKDIVAKKTPTPLTKPTTKAAAKDKMRVFIFKTRTSISSLMSFFVTTLAINHLF